MHVRSVPNLPLPRLQPWRSSVLPPMSRPRTRPLWQQRHLRRLRSHCPSRPSHRPNPRRRPRHRSRNRRCRRSRPLRQSRHLRCRFRNLHPSRPGRCHRCPVRRPSRFPSRFRTPRSRIRSRRRCRHLLHRSRSRKSDPRRSQSPPTHPPPDSRTKPLRSAVDTVGEWPLSTSTPCWSGFANAPRR